MTLEEMQSIFSLLFGYGFAGVIGGSVFFLLVKYLFPGYLLQKGKNLATKEDIKNITNIVESVKTDHAEILEEIKSNNQIRIAAIEREKAMKKEVYMDVVEVFDRCENIVSDLINLDIAEDQLSSVFSNASGKLAKVLIVGEKDTISAVTSFAGEIATAFIDLMLERSLLMQRKQDIESLERSRNQHQSEFERYVILMKNLNIGGNNNQDTGNNINNSIKLECEEIDKLDDEIDKLRNIQIKEYFEFMDKCYKRVSDVSKFLPKAVLSIRSELELDIDASDYLKIFESNRKKEDAMWNNSIAKIKAQIAAINTGA